MIPIQEKLTAERTLRVRLGDDWNPTPGHSLILEFFTKNRVSNYQRVLEVLSSLKISRDSFALNEFRARVPAYELAEELVKKLNSRGHLLSRDGRIAAFSLGNWCDREQLNRVDFAWDVRTIAAFIATKGLEIAAVEVPQNLTKFLTEKCSPGISVEDNLELIDLLDCYSHEPLRILTNTRDR